MNTSRLHEALNGAITGRDGGGETRVLFVALSAVPPAERPDGEVLVVAPALNSRLRHWVSDEDAARRRAEERVVGFVERLEQSGVRAEGRVGDADPLQAIADALTTFPADEVVIVAPPERSTRESGAAHDLLARARSRFALPIFLAGESLPIAA